MGDLKNKSIIPGNTLRRNNFSVNLNATLSKRWSFLLNGKYITEKNNNRPRLSDSPGNTNYTLITMPNSLSVETMWQNKYTPEGFEFVSTDNTFVQNAYFSLDDYKQKDSKSRIIASFEPKFNITDDIYLKGRVGFDKFNYRNVSIIPTGTGYLNGGSYTSMLRDFYERNMEMVVGLDKKIGDRFSVSAVAGGNAMRQVYNNEDYSGSPFNIPFFLTHFEC